ncbi:MAG: alpha/beta hydrolase [Burkholderiales bacterium]|jgi:pimeloyl-ACP methyl ester carboxylesterase|nr:alpha/beta hydrolase [Burkholderiales bacterium]
MNEPRLQHVQCLGAKGLHRMGYWEWGDAANPKVLVCVHGLTRQGRDFDTLARSLCHHYRVVCPDVAGRGQSDWLADPMGYQLAAYVADMVTLLARLNAATVHWVGTSMGGLIGIGVASLANSPVRRLVLNDVGPTIQLQAVQRIGLYVGLPMRWDSVQAAAAYMLSISQGFGPHTEQQWLDLTWPMLRADGAGFKPHYDPGIGVPFRAVTPETAAAGEALLWRSYDAIVCPALLLRGAQSDLLSPETALAMTQRGPKAALREFAGVGHAPTLIAADQIDAVAGFLLSP